MDAAEDAGRPSGGVAYILKRYPRLSETFIVNEILALERQGVSLHVLAAARPREDLHHEMVDRVRAPVTYTRKRSRQLWGAADQQLWPQAGVSRPLRAALLHTVDRSADPGEARDELAQALMVAAQVRRAGIVHLHAHFATSAARVACLTSRMTGVPFSFTAHAKDIFLKSVDVERLSSLLKSALFVVAISSYHAHFLRALQPAARLEKVTNGLDLSRVMKSAPLVGRHNDGIGEAGASTRPIILGVGRLVEKKGFVDLVRACALLKDRGVSFRCRIVGEGPERGRLEALIARCHLQGWCELPGARRQEDVHRALREATLLAAPCVILPSGDRDGLPTVILEAMAHGTPVISTPVTAIPEIVEPDRTGLLVPERDPEALAGRLEELLARPRRRLRLARAARLALIERHDVNRSAARLATLFCRQTISPGAGESSPPALRERP